MNITDWFLRLFKKYSNILIIGQEHFIVKGDIKLTKEKIKLTEDENALFKEALAFEFTPNKKRKINEIIIHCSDSKWGTVEIIREWHILPKDQPDGTVKYKGKTYNSRVDLPKSVQKKYGRAFSDIGYNYVITNGYPDYSTLKEDEYQPHFDGKIRAGRPMHRIGAHCLGHNKNSIGVCLVGKYDEMETFNGGFSDNQMKTLKMFLLASIIKFEIRPDHIYPHYAFSTKTCPCFNPYERIIGNLISLIKKFQIGNDLYVDGIIGPITKSKLEEVYKI